MDPNKCNATTQKGTLCQWDWHKCKVHDVADRPLPAPPRPLPTSERPIDHSDEPEPRLSSPALNAALEKRDLRSLFWLTLEGVLHGDMTEKLAAIVATLGRAIQALGEEDTDREAAIAESVVIGTVMHGFPPRDEAQWEIARKYFDEHTLAGLVDWKPLDGWFSTVGARQWPKPEPHTVDAAHVRKRSGAGDNPGASFEPA